ncbi:hypothetical protein M422DRAFT_249762 [Sphaerobolus stellatus SS14]|uniref:Uncharacterized protein n=1 Tax=Sphaerobolus stellatus (strain SS14) TaxID=990650 RepID=A0A0C9W4R1_SPHS4|nr:hypothetical protein M422DRAFT_249762 [Sphaerobolus stellatus SS14]
MLLFSSYFISLLFQISVRETSAVLVNVTVDDAGVDPSTGQSIVYTPGGPWHEGNTCSFCTDKPDPASMHNETWHDATYVPDDGQGDPTGSSNLTFSFNGTAIYAFCAIQRFTNMTFFIDDEPVNQFSQQSDIFLYNIPVFVNTSLSPGKHVFTLVNGATDGSGNKPSTVLFDYLIYLHDEVDEQSSPLPLPSPSGSDSQPRPGLGSGAIGGIAAAAIVITLSCVTGAFCWYRRQRSGSCEGIPLVQPFDASTGIFFGSSVQQLPSALAKSTENMPNNAVPSPSIQGVQLVPGQVATDAGPLLIQNPYNAADILPPDYTV